MLWVTKIQEAQRSILKSKMIALFHNLGLGDHIICNGLVRELYKIHQPLMLFVLERNQVNVRHMFSDLQELSLNVIPNDRNPYQFVEQEKMNVINVAGNAHGYGFERAFYERAGIDYSKKWDSFKIPRNMDVEIELFKKLSLKEGEYSFIHEWGNKKIKNVPNMVNVRPLKELGPFFDFGYTIENAVEIHCMESSFKNLVEFLNLKTDLLFFHVNGRTASRSESKLGWTEI